MPADSAVCYRAVCPAHIFDPNVLAQPSECVSIVKWSLLNFLKTHACSLHSWPYGLWRFHVSVLSTFTSSGSLKSYQVAFLCLFAQWSAVLVHSFQVGLWCVVATSLHMTIYILTKRIIRSISDTSVRAGQRTSSFMVQQSLTSIVQYTNKRHSIIAFNKYRTMISSRSFSY